MKSVQAQPVVSAIVSTFNSERFIRGRLEDLEAQTIGDRLEIIVIDSGSEQKEGAIVQEFQKRFSNIHYIRTERESVYGAWNRGVQVARGKYLTNSNTDDRLRKDALEIMARALDLHPEAGFVYGDTLITRGENETFENHSAVHYHRRPDFSLRQMLLSGFFGPQPMWRRSAHERLGLFNPQLVVAGDYDFFLNVSWQMGALHLREKLGLYLEHPVSIEHRNRSRCIRETLELQRRYRNIIPLEDLYPQLRTAPDAQLARAACLVDQGNCCLHGGVICPLDAMMYFSQAMDSIGPIPEIMGNLACAMFYSGKVDQAAKRLQKLSESLPLAKINLERIEHILKSGAPFETQKLNLYTINHPVVEAAKRGRGLTLSGSRFIPVESRETCWTGPEMIKPLPSKASKQCFRPASMPNSVYGSAQPSTLEREAPLVSIIVPTYNRPEMLEEALESIARQTFQDFEVLVVNDGGQEVGDVVGQFNQNGGERFKYLSLALNGSMSAARNRAIREARGKYIAYLDDDDIFYSDHLETLVDSLENSDFRIAYTDSNLVGYELRGGCYTPISRSLYMSYDFKPWFFLQDNFTPNLNVMHERSCFETMGLFDEALDVLEDWELWIRFSRQFDFLHIPRVTSEVRTRQDNSHITSQRMERFPPARKYVFEKHKDTYGSLNAPQVQEWQQAVLGFRRWSSTAFEPLLTPRSADTTRFSHLKVALIYDNTGDPATTGEYCRRTMEKVCFTRHILPHYLYSLAPGDFDLYIHIDDSLSYGLPSHLKPVVWWIIDSRMDPVLDIEKAHRYDAVFSAHYDTTLTLRTSAVPAHWLPLAADPSVWRPERSPQTFDWCFMGKFPEPDRSGGPELNALLGALKDRFPNHHGLKRYGAEKCRLYSQSRVVFSHDERADASPDLFEAMACGRPVLANLAAPTGWHQLFTENKDLVAYHSTEDLLEKMGTLLANEASCAKMGRFALEAVLSRHTFTHRLGAMLELLSGAGVLKLEASRFNNEPARSNALISRQPSQPLTSIVILTYNQLECTKNCLASIGARTPLPHELLLVDNHSTDGTLDYLRAYASVHENVRVVANESNRGFSAGNNQGISIARGEFVLLLNNDTVVSPGWLERLLAVFSKHPSTGIVGPMSNHVDGPQIVPNASYGSLAEMEAFASRLCSEFEGQSDPAPRVVGFCLLARRAVIDRIGGLDERFGTGNFEDDDFCLRAALAGYETRIVRDAFVHHVGSQTFRGAKINYSESMHRNWAIFKSKWHIPMDLPLDRYQEKHRFIPKEALDPSTVYIALPDIGSDHRAELDSRWWQESGN